MKVRHCCTFLLEFQQTSCMDAVNIKCAFDRLCAFTDTAIARHLSLLGQTLTGSHGNVYSYGLNSRRPTRQNKDGRISRISNRTELLIKSSRIAICQELRDVNSA